MFMVLSVCPCPSNRWRAFSSISFSCDATMLLPPIHTTSMASRSLRFLSLTRRAFSSSFSHEGRVSLVQGASRGIGLEFVRFLLPYVTFTSSMVSYNLGTLPHCQNCSFFHGLCFLFLLQVKQLLENNEKEHVVATCRNPSASTGLFQLKDKFADRLRILQLDLTVESFIEVMLLWTRCYVSSFEYIGVEWAKLV